MSVAENFVWLVFHSQCRDWYNFHIWVFRHFYYIAVVNLFSSSISTLVKEPFLPIVYRVFATRMVNHALKLWIINPKSILYNPQKFVATNLFIKWPLQVLETATASYHIRCSTLFRLLQIYFYWKSSRIITYLYVTLI